MQLFANNITTSLASALTSTATTVRLLSLVGFPIVTSPDHLLITVTGGGNLEILKITSISGNNIVTVARGQEGTTASAFPVNSIVSVNLTKGTLEAFRDEEIALNTLITKGKPKLISKTYAYTSITLDAGLYVFPLVGGGGGGGGGGNQSDGTRGQNGGTSGIRVVRSIGADINYSVAGGTGGSGGWFQIPGCGGGGGGDGVDVGFGGNGNGGMAVRGTEGDGDAGGAGGYNVSSIFGGVPGDGELIINERPGLVAGKAAQSLTVIVNLLESAQCTLLAGVGGLGGAGGRLPGGSTEPTLSAKGKQGSNGFCSVLRLG